MGDRGCGGDTAAFVFCMIPWLFFSQIFSSILGDYLLVVCMSAISHLNHFYCIAMARWSSCDFHHACRHYELHWHTVPTSSKKFHAQELHGLKAAALNGQVQY